MRRPRPHRLTGSARRLLAATVLGLLAAAVAVTATSGPASADGLSLNVSLGGLNLGSTLPVALPSLQLPTGTPSVTPTPSASLPGTGSVTNLCLANCPPTSTNNNGPTSNTKNTAPGSSRTPAIGGSATRSSSGTTSALGGDSSAPSSATSTISLPQSLGLAVAPPPPVDQLTPLAGISFGQAPYLWPLFLLLDVIGAAAVVLLVRRTWSSSSGAD